MTRYRRDWTPGGSWFFTVALAQRTGNRLLVERVDALREAFRAVRLRRPFDVEAVVVLPEHLHCILTLPPGDADYATRWGLIKAGFSRTVPVGERRSASRLSRGERGIWQRRYWEHRIRDETDLARHVDYIHFNPVKHGHVEQVRQWPHSSFHRYVRDGLLPADWGDGMESNGVFGEPT